jgi:hypothetical protein
LRWTDVSSFSYLLRLILSARACCCSSMIRPSDNFKIRIVSEININQVYAQLSALYRLNLCFKFYVVRSVHFETKQFNPSLHIFTKTWQKFHLIKYIQKHNKYYTKITLLKIFPNLNEDLYMYHIWYIMVIVNFYIIWICITYDTTCLILTSEGGSSRSHYVESWLWKSLWTCRETDC